jgi:subtilisin family serine protease
MTEQLERYAPPGLRDIERALGSWEERLRRREIVVAARPDGMPVLVRPSSVLAKAVDDVAVERLVPVADRIGVSVTGADSGDVRRIGNYVRLDVEPDDVGSRHPRWSVRPVARAIAELGEQGFKLRPNHVFLADDLELGAPWLLDHPSYVANSVGMLTSQPRTTARPAARIPLPEPLDLPGRRRPRVLVLDTGLRAVEEDGVLVAEHSALRDTVKIHSPWRTSPGVCTIDDDDEPHGDDDGYVDLCAGHGTFITGIVRRICPDAQVHVDGVLSSFGDGDDDTIEAGIGRAAVRIAPNAFDVVILALGAYTSDDRFPPLAAAVQAIASQPGTVVVASAGNNGSPRPYFPAAIPEVIAVGALDGQRRAWFSNYGGWVDACAPGVDVVSTYFCDVADAEGDSAVRYRGWAAWNGTSFAAPKVAAAIAQDMYLHGGTAKDAWKRLSSWQRARHPDLGVVFNIV